MGLLRSDTKVKLPGVVYYNERSVIPGDGPKYVKPLYNVITENLKEGTSRSALESPKVLPGPEETTGFTYWERMGWVPIHPSRLRPRQHYMPTTDFNMYDYDEKSPEEKELYSRWLARTLDLDASIPIAALLVSWVVTMPFHAKVRVPLLLLTMIGAVTTEITRASIRAAPARQDLDDFHVAKEIWYIKNVEAYQMGVPLIPKGREVEFQEHIHLHGDMTEEMAEALH